MLMDSLPSPDLNPHRRPGRQGWSSGRARRWPRRLPTGVLRRHPPLPRWPLRRTADPSPRRCGPRCCAASSAVVVAPPVGCAAVLAAVAARATCAAAPSPLVVAGCAAAPGPGDQCPAPLPPPLCVVVPGRAPAHRAVFSVGLAPPEKSAIGPCLGRQPGTTRHGPTRKSHRAA
jgi:hypothetical protein